jgi:hypothetical protein
MFLVSSHSVCLSSDSQFLFPFLILYIPSQNLIIVMSCFVINNTDLHSLTVCLFSADYDIIRTMIKLDVFFSHETLSPTLCNNTKQTQLEPTCTENICNYEEIGGKTTIQHTEYS